MMGNEMPDGLPRALQLSIELLQVAESGDVRATVHLDAERRRLLDSARSRSMPMDADERLMLQRISELNDQAIGFLEHRRRIKAREMDTATLGRRATAAYSTTRMHP